MKKTNLILSGVLVFGILFGSYKSYTNLQATQEQKQNKNHQINAINESSLTLKDFEKKYSDTKDKNMEVSANSEDIVLKDQNILKEITENQNILQQSIAKSVVNKTETAKTTNKTNQTASKKTSQTTNKTNQTQSADGYFDENGNVKATENKDAKPLVPLDKWLENSAPSYEDAIKSGISEYIK